MHHEEVVSVSSFFLRFTIGITFLALGWVKATSPGQQSIWLDVLQALPGSSLLWLNIMVYAEIIIGLMLIIGVFTNYAASAGALLLLIHLFFLNWFYPVELLGAWGPYAIKDIAILGACISLAVQGAPIWSVDSLFN